MLPLEREREREMGTAILLIPKRTQAVCSSHLIKTFHLHYIRAVTKEKQLVREIKKVFRSRILKRMKSQSKTFKQLSRLANVKRRHKSVENPWKFLPQEKHLNEVMLRVVSSPWPSSGDWRSQQELLSNDNWKTLCDRREDFRHQSSV